MNLFLTRQRLSSESNGRPGRHREFDAVVIATAGILLAVAFWMHRRDHGEDSQANSRVVQEKVVADEVGPPAPNDTMASQHASP